MDERAIEDLAREALSVQDACNLSGVVHGFTRALARLRVLLGDPGTTRLNEHPISKLWADKIASLAGVQGSGWAVQAYNVVHELSRGGGYVGAAPELVDLCVEAGGALPPEAGPEGFEAQAVS